MKNGRQAQKESDILQKNLEKEEVMKKRHRKKEVTRGSKGERRDKEFKKYKSSQIVYEQIS